ncbi:hypothetical protein [Actinokineospora spheciospongiae]|uniref:hypothetical protein n=1 Tax=Actinokineospora spheciospongiae TaxID=909613 RepID=UPI0004BC0473|nr:hypothetical protein [Actinokineospora spheciospongiae]
MSEAGCVEFVADGVRALVPGVTVDARASGGHGGHLVDVEVPGGLDAQVLVADRSAFGTVLFGRYVFDAVAIERLPAVVAKLVTGDLSLVVTGLSRRTLELTVDVAGEAHTVWGSRSFPPLEDWEVEALGEQR